MKTTKEAMGLCLVVGILFFAGCTNYSAPQTTTTQATMMETTTTLAPTTTIMVTTTKAATTTMAPAPTTTLAPTVGKTFYVTIDAFDFDPKPLTILKGDTVVWTNKQQNQHTVTSSDNSGELNSGTLKPMDTYSHTFNTVGNYAYYSKLHTQATGVIYVKLNQTVSNPTTDASNSAMGESTAGEAGNSVGT